MANSQGEPGPTEDLSQTPMTLALTRTEIMTLLHC